MWVFSRNLTRLPFSMKCQQKSRSHASRPLLFLLTFLILILLVLISLREGSDSYLFMAELSTATVGGDIDRTAAATVPNDRPLGGLFSPYFDEQTCLSRYHAQLHRKPSTHILSSYLISKIRKYEALHKKCAPKTPLYQKSVEQLRLNQSTNQLECNYVVWIPHDGIGNRMMSLVATYLYALLTNRVMLIHLSEDMIDLFCEPFPKTTWLLPSDFPLNVEGYDIHSRNSYGYLVEQNLINTDPNALPSSLPSYVYVHVNHDFREAHLHTRFFCDKDQEVIKKINWVLLRSNQYFSPELFIMSNFGEELVQMFPLKETVFHHLGRYLLHPNNIVWDMITTYYNSYLARSKELIGIQVRIFPNLPLSLENVTEQVVRCTQQELILPSVNLKNQSQVSPASSNEEAISVLLVSLSEEVYKRLHAYYMHPTTTGEMINVYQPSHEETQQTGMRFHNYKALSEIWLLSFSDVLVTTAGSTFGYVSYSLAGIKPWFLQSAYNQNIPDPPCRRGATIDACYHVPSNFNCKTGNYADTGNLVRHLRPCDDFRYVSAVKLFD